MTINFHMAAFLLLRDAFSSLQHAAMKCLCVGFPFITENNLHIYMKL